MIRGNAMMGVREIGRLEDTLRRLGAVPRSAALLLAPKLTRLLRQQFSEGKDPYGRPWAPLRPSTLRKHGPPPLTYTRKLRSGTKAVVPRANYAGVRVVTGTSYAYFHQVGFHVGGRRVPARRVLPQYGLPKAWNEAIKSSLLQAARRARRSK